MPTEMGEYIVGAYLQLVLGCDHVAFNVRPPGGGLKGLNELDVLGMQFKTGAVYLCEVATHLAGLNYGYGGKEAVARVTTKLARQTDYARECLPQFQKHVFMFWSPVVQGEALIGELKKIERLELYINQTYTDAIDKLRAIAAQTKSEIGNPFFRALQILEHLRRG